MAEDGKKPKDFESTVRLNLSDLDPYAKDEEPESDTFDTSVDDAEMNFMDLQAELDAMDESLADFGRDTRLNSSDSTHDNTQLADEQLETLVMDRQGEQAPTSVDDDLNVLADLEDDASFSFQDFDISDHASEVDELQDSGDDFQLNQFFDEDQTIKIDEMLSSEFAKDDDTLVLKDRDDLEIKAKAESLDDFPILEMGDVDADSDTEFESQVTAAQETTMDISLDQELDFDDVNLQADEEISLIDVSLVDELPADGMTSDDAKADEDFAAAYAIDEVLPEFDVSDSNTSVPGEEMHVGESVKQIKLPVDEKADASATAASLASVQQKSTGDSSMPNQEKSKTTITKNWLAKGNTPQIMVAAALAAGLLLGGAGVWLAMSSEAQVSELQSLLQASQAKVTLLEEELTIEKSRVVADAPALAFKDETPPEVVGESQAAAIAEIPAADAIRPMLEEVTAKVISEQAVEKPVLKTTVKPITPQTPSVKDSGVWLVNVSSEPTMAGAEKVQKALLDADINSVITPANIKGRDWYRVQLTGFDTSAAAKVYIKTLELELGYKGMWVGHE